MTLNLKHPAKFLPVAVVAALLALTALGNAIAMFAFSVIALAIWSVALCFKRPRSMSLELVAGAVCLAVVVAIACAMMLTVS